MNGPSADGLLEAGGAMEAEGDGASEEATPRRISTSGQTSRLGMGNGDGDGEEATGRGILPSVTPSYQRSAKSGHGMTEAGGAMDLEGDAKKDLEFFHSLLSAPAKFPKKSSHATEHKN